MKPENDTVETNYANMVSELTLGTGVLSAGHLTSIFHHQKLKMQTQMDEKC